MHKTYDTHDHTILLDILSVCGLHPCLDMSNSYLSNTTKVDAINGIKSDKAELDIGISQRSVLDPLLVSIYVKGNFPSHLMTSVIKC